MSNLKPTEAEKRALEEIVRAEVYEEFRRHELALLGFRRRAWRLKFADWIEKKRNSAENSRYQLDPNKYMREIPEIN